MRLPSISLCNKLLLAFACLLAYRFLTVLDRYLNNFSNEFMMHRLPDVGHAVELGALMALYRGRTMLQVGLDDGVLAKRFLRQWHNLERFYGVDEFNSIDDEAAKVTIDPDRIERNPDLEPNEELPVEREQAHFERIMTYLQDYAGKVNLRRLSSRQAAALVDDYSLDLVLLNNNTDYCGAWADLELFWPKVKYGGLLAGSNYLDPPPASRNRRRRRRPNSDRDEQRLPAGVFARELCDNGTRGSSVPGGVREAVHDFVRLNQIFELKRSARDERGRRTYYFMKRFRLVID